jgi:hypothetical protein
MENDMTIDGPPYPVNTATPDQIRVTYELATAMARLFQSRTPSDEQIGWFMEDAEAVVGDFDPPPEKWRLS